MRKKLKYKSDFLNGRDNNCWLCNVGPDGTHFIKKYFKYNKVKLKPCNQFSRENKYQKIDTRFNETFNMCDTCKVYWHRTPESLDSNWYYTKFVREHYQAEPKNRENKKIYDELRRQKEREENG